MSYDLHGNPVSTDYTLVARIERLEVKVERLEAALEQSRAEVAEWKRRAAKHGCDTEHGDPDCG